MWPSLYNVVVQQQTDTRVQWTSLWVHREAGLDYNNMVLLTLTMPSGFVAEDLRRDRERNPSVMRMEEKDDQVHCYMNQVRPLLPLV